MGIAEGSSRRKTDNKNDFFQTPYLATEALLENYIFLTAKHLAILDPCEGKGAISKVLKKYSLNYTGIDKYPQLSSTKEKDFLEYTIKSDIIISNPPYSMKNDFIEHALFLANHVFMILPMAVVNYNHFHRNFLNRKEYKGRLLLTPKFFMSQEINEDYSLKKGGVSSYAWFHWSNSKTISKSSYERYCDLDVLKEELD